MLKWLKNNFCKSLYKGLKHEKQMSFYDIICINNNNYIKGAYLKIK